MDKCFYITTAIDYVNGLPHLGHAYEKILADVIARFHRSLGEKVFFLTGLDEHGQKVQQAAQAQGKTPQAYCDELAVHFRKFASCLELTIDDFVRTSEPRHKQVVQNILAKLNQDGHFYKKTYTGFYSTKEETFLTDKDRRADGTFDPAYGDVIELREDNYFFRLAPHQQWLIKYIEENPGFVSPESRRNEVLGFLKNSVLEDLCISRPASRLTWGITIPFDPDYVTYVWFDALVNYASIPAARHDAALADFSTAAASGSNEQPRLWPANIHLIGKDILKFHAVYWPIMLKAMNLPMPKQVLVHGWWQKDGEKISKSTGNIVDPISVVDQWGLDAFRFYVVRELDIGPDGNWTDAGFKARYEAELANGLGNLVNRSISMLNRYRNGVVPARSNELAQDAEKVVAKTRSLLEENHLQGALLEIWELVGRANQYVEQTAPFKMAKDPAKAARLDEVLYNLVEACRVLAVLLWPFLPGAASKIYGQLAINSTPDKFADAIWGKLEPGHKVGPASPLFPKKED
jgi:methionyl-tRNA synthetase